MGFRAWLGLAHAGISEAQFAVGQYYFYGKAVPPCLSEAVRWFQMSASAGCVAAQSRMAVLAMQGVTVRWLSSTVPARYRSLFRSTQSAESAPPDFDAALAWGWRAALRNDVDAMALVGYLLSFGPPHIRDFSRARIWLERAVASGSGRAALSLALLLTEKASSANDATKILQLLIQASHEEVPLAIRLLAISSEYGLGQDRNLDMATTLYERAATARDQFSQAKLGIVKLTGHGAPVDDVSGETWLRKSALSGGPVAAAILGEMYLVGNLLPINRIEAQRWLDLAAQCGHKGALRALGVAYMIGTFGVVDKDSGLRYLVDSI